MEKTVMNDSNQNLQVAYQNKCDECSELFIENAELTQLNQQLKSEVKKLKSKLEDANDNSGRGCGWSLFAVMTFVLGMVVGGVLDGCEARSDVYVDQPAIVQKVTSHSVQKCEYSIKGHRVVLIDQKKKYNVGDTIKFTK